MGYSDLLNLLWRAGHFTGREFTSCTGERVEITATGEASDTLPGIWTAAGVVVDGERRRGTVALGEDVPLPGDTVLRVTAAEDASPVLGADDRLVTQIGYMPPHRMRERYLALREGAEDRACAAAIARMSSLHRTSLYTALLVERFRRKTARIKDIFETAEQDWNQTFHVLLFQSMGGDRNRETFGMLAAKATAAMVSREKSSVMRIEALLLGAAGFLFGGAPGKNSGRGSVPEKDDYTLRLEEEFRHLAAKYSIVPLKPAVWDTANVRTSNHPALRLAEIAALFCKKDFMLDGVLRCRTSEDVERLFGVQASEYWDTHYKPGVEHGCSPKRIGREKTRLIGINLAAPLMFAYGRGTGREELCERALDLLASIPAENNRLLAGWYAGGCVAESGFDSQALLQLGGEYCAKGACTGCRIGREEIKKVLAEATSTIIP